MNAHKTHLNISPDIHKKKKSFARTYMHVICILIHFIKRTKFVFSLRHLGRASAASRPAGQWPRVGESLICMYGYAFAREYWFSVCATLITPRYLVGSFAPYSFPSRGCHKLQSAAIALSPSPLHTFTSHIVIIVVVIHTRLARNVHLRLCMGRRVRAMQNSLNYKRTKKHYLPCKFSFFHWAVLSFCVYLSISFSTLLSLEIVVLDHSLSDIVKI